MINFIKYRVKTTNESSDIKKYFKLCLVLIWCTLIFVFSNQKASESTKLSNSLIINIVEKINKDVNQEKKENIVKKYDFVIRKAAHFSLYFVLGILIYNLLLEYDIKNKFLLALLLTHLYSISDEIHQIFIAGRSCEYRDILIDSIGALFGIYFISSILRFEHKKKKYVTI